MYQIQYHKQAAAGVHSHQHDLEKPCWKARRQSRTQTLVCSYCACSTMEKAATTTLNQRTTEAEKVLHISWQLAAVWLLILSFSIILKGEVPGKSNMWGLLTQIPESRKIIYISSFGWRFYSRSQEPWEWEAPSVNVTAVTGPKTKWRISLPYFLL